MMRVYYIKTVHNLVVKKGGIFMAPAAIKLTDMLDNLEDEDYNVAITFIQYLSETRKKKNVEENKAILKEIQNIFSDDPGWDSEESMIADMAAFRRGRMQR